LNTLDEEQFVDMKKHTRKGSMTHESAGARKVAATEPEIKQLFFCKSG